ncbi:MAG TPA: Rrf2 family transcriptional regulator [Bacteroidales bacterium]|nr:Rrf2 family transcriptional regulator [Bacteroidales bacterium]HQQ11573.1 Rrf2 family transcriptional regulator [Bacteroidales bacterium]
MLSNACKYAIRAMIYLAAGTDNHLKVNIKELATAVDSPLPFTAKIMQSLSKLGFVSSSKGPSGGFFLSTAQLQTKLLDIVMAIDGPKELNGCGLGLANCNEQHPCPLHQDYKIIRDRFKNLLHENTIHSLAQSMKQGNSVLKNML